MRLSFGTGWSFVWIAEFWIWFHGSKGNLNGVEEMQSIAEIYVGLSVWKAAILYLGFVEHQMSTEGLAEFIRKKNTASVLDHEKWIILHKAVEKGDLQKIKKIALEPVERDVPWPSQWAAIGREFKRTCVFG